MFVQGFDVECASQRGRWQARKKRGIGIIPPFVVWYLMKGNRLIIYCLLRSQRPEWSVTTVTLLTWTSMVNIGQGMVRGHRVRGLRIGELDNLGPASPLHSSSLSCSLPLAVCGNGTSDVFSHMALSDECVASN